MLALAPDAAAALCASALIASSYIVGRNNPSVKSLKTSEVLPSASAQILGAVTSGRKWFPAQCLNRKEWGRQVERCKDDILSPLRRRHRIRC